MMNEPERIVIPGLPCTSNHGYGLSARRGHAIMYKTAAGQAWQETVGWSTMAQRVQPPQEWRKKWIAFTMTMYMPRPLSQDWDGGIKLTCDAVAEALGFDDRYVVMGTVRKVRTKCPEETVITVEEVDF